jgi:acetyl-CoA acetyltransferase
MNTLPSTYKCSPFSFINNVSAQEGGRFKEEIVPISIKGRKGPEEFSVDEHPRPQTTLEQASKLPPVFKKGGTVTAANASVRSYYLNPLTTGAQSHLYACVPEASLEIMQIKA